MSQDKLTPPPDASHRTWNGQPSPYWQHREPISCPKQHVMGWLGSVFWLCSCCKTIYVQVKDKADE